MISWTFCGKCCWKNKVILGSVGKRFHQMPLNIHIEWKCEAERNATSLSSIFHHTCTSDFILMQNQLYLCHKCPLEFIDKYFHNWLFEWVAFGHSTVDIFTPTPLFLFFFVYSVMPVSQLLCEWAGAKKKRGEVGYSNILHQPTQNYSMWWYKSYLIMWEHAGLPAVMKGARCSDIPGEASWTISHAAEASALILRV